MSVICQCPSCKAKYQVGDQFAGHTVKCPKCSAAVAVPAMAGPLSSKGDSSQVLPAGAARANSAPSSSRIELHKAQAVVPANDSAGKNSSSSRIAKAAGLGDIVLDDEAGRSAAENELDFLNEDRAKAASRAAQAAADISADENVISGIGPRSSVSSRGSTARSSKSALGYRPKKKKQGLPAWVIPTIAASAIAVIAAVVYVAYLAVTRSKTEIAAADKAGTEAAKTKVPAKKVPLLTIDWEVNQRAGASLYIDGEKRDLPLTGPIQVPLPPRDQPYEVKLVRKGFEPKVFRRAAVEDDSGYVAKDWESTVNGSDLEQDFEVAKKNAAEHKKNVLIVFDASDAKESSAASKRLGEAVLLRREFTDQAKQEFVCVYVDNLQHGDPDHRVQDAARNRELSDKFHISLFPTVVVTDPKGRPFGVMEGYTINGVNAFLALVKQWEADSKILFKLLDKVDVVLHEGKASGPESHENSGEIVKMLDFLQLNDLDRFYKGTVKKLTAGLPAGESRPPVSKETAELWIEKFHLATKNPDEAKRIVDKFDQWKKTRVFKDPDIGARLHLAAAAILWRLGYRPGSEGMPNSKEAGDLIKAAAEKCKEGLDFHPRDSQTKKGLEQLSQYLKHEPGKPMLIPFGSGSGFCVAQGNYIMTNHHVIEGAKVIRIHLNNEEERYPAKLVGDDETHDLALLKVELPAAKKLAPIPLAPKLPKIGEEVRVMGWPGDLAENAGATVTKGIISTMVGSNEDDRMIATDSKAWHGDSGGPLCSAVGVVGMIQRGSSLDATAFGLSIPVDRLRKFAMEKLPVEARKLVAPPAAAGLRLEDQADIFQRSVVFVENVQEMNDRAGRAGQEGQAQEK